MSLTQTIINSLKNNIKHGAGFFRSPDGVFEVTWLPDENKGYIDIKNPSNVKFKDLKAKALQYIKNLPKGKWEFNPDTAQKGKIYGQRIFKGVKGVTANPNMPNNALTYDNRSAPSGNNTVMKIIKNTPKPNLKIGAGGSNTYSKQINSPGKFGFDDEMFNHMNLENYHKIITPGGVFPRV